MRPAACPRCEESIADSEAVCPECGWAVELPAISDDRVIEPMVEPRSMLPAVREDLAPLVPTLKKAATVVATAALADWALRRGTQRILSGGLAAAAPKALGFAGRRERRPATTETILVEQQVTVRHWITRRS